jgi:hypothetical protein
MRTNKSKFTYVTESTVEVATKIPRENKGKAFVLGWARLTNWYIHIHTCNETRTHRERKDGHTILACQVHSSQAIPSLVFLVNGREGSGSNLTDFDQIRSDRTKQDDIDTDFNFNSVDDAGVPMPCSCLDKRTALARKRLHSSIADPIPSPSPYPISDTTPDIYHIYHSTIVSPLLFPLRSNLPWGFKPPSLAPNPMKNGSIDIRSTSKGERLSTYIVLIRNRTQDTRDEGDVDECQPSGARSPAEVLVAVDIVLYMIRSGCVSAGQRTCCMVSY